MIYLWVGVFAGLAVSYLVMRRSAVSLGRRERLRRLARRLQRSTGYHALAPADRIWRFRLYWMVDWWPATLGWAAVSIGAAVLLILIAHGVYHTWDDRSSLQSFMMRFTRGTLAPLVTGVLIGGVFLRLFAEALRGHPLLGLSALGVICILGLLLARDPDLTLFGNLKSASVAGVSFELRGESRGGQGQPGQALPGSGAQDAWGPSHISYALQQLMGLKKYVERDQDYARASGYVKHVHFREIERGFISGVVVPTAERLWKLHEQRAFSDIAVLVDRTFVSEIRELVEFGEADARASQRGAESAARPAERTDQVLLLQSHMARLTTRFASLWEGICRAEKMLRASKHVGKPDECEADGRAVLGAVRTTTASLAQSVFPVFSHEHPYGLVLSALVLHMAREDDAALRDLYDWVHWTEKDLRQLNARDSARWIGLYRGFHLYAYVAARQSRAPIFRHVSLRAWSKTVEIAELILNGPGWRGKADYFANWRQRDARWGPDNRPIRCNQSDRKDVFLAFYFSYLAAKNNLVHNAAIDYDFAKQERIVTDVMRRVDELGDIPFDCLRSDLITEKHIQELRQATSDSRMRMLLAYSKDEDEGEAKRKKAACSALELAKSSRTRLLVKEKMLLGPDAPDTFEKHFDAADDAQTVVLAAEQLREARRLVELLGAQDAC